MILTHTQKCTGMVTTNSGKCLPVGQEEETTASVTCMDNAYFASWEVTVWLFIISLSIPFIMANISQ